MTENEISAEILDAAIAVHNSIGGPGVLESYYEAALACELELRGPKVETQKNVPIVYKGRTIGEQPNLLRAGAYVSQTHEFETWDSDQFRTAKN